MIKNILIVNFYPKLKCFGKIQMLEAYPCQLTTYLRVKLIFKMKDKEDIARLDRQTDNS